LSSAGFSLCGFDFCGVPRKIRQAEACPTKTASLSKTQERAMKKNEPKTNLPRRDFVKAAFAGIGATALTGIGAEGAQAAGVTRHWDKVADVVVVGAGASGLPASIEAAEHGASVIVIDQNYDIGGHAIESGGNIALGGGTSLQKKYGIEDSPDRMFEDLVNWHDYRFSDREIVRAFCDWSAPTFEWLLKHGVVFPDKSPGQADGGPETVKRAQTVTWTGEVSAYAPNGGNGTALMRPLEASARKLGVQILLQHSMTGLVRDGNFSGRVLGITAAFQGKTLNIQAKKAVFLGTGGHTSNVNFRRIFDPRLTEEYQVVGEPYSRQTGDGEIAAMQIGASLWGAANQTVETLARSHIFEKPYVIGNQYGYPQGGGHRKENLKDSPIAGLARAIGLQVTNYQNIIHVNQVGYLPNYSKKAMVGYYLGSLGEMELGMTNAPLKGSTNGFKLIEAQSGKEVFQGPLVPRPDRGFPAGESAGRPAPLCSVRRPFVAAYGHSCKRIRTKMGS